MSGVVANPPPATSVNAAADAPAFLRLATLLGLLGLLARLAAYALAPGPLVPDEDFQYLEQAHRLALGTGLVPWEYVIGIRSWLLPGALAPVFAAARLVGGDPRIALWAVAVLLSLLSLPSIWCAMRWGQRAAGWSGAAAAGVLQAFWFEIVYFAPHATADTIAASLLVPGLYLAGLGRPPPSRATRWLGGVLLGLTVAVRLQLAPLVLLMALRALRRGQFQPLALGIALPILLSGALDAVTLSYPFQSLWLYAWVNLGLGAAASFGTSPWYEYVSVKILFWSVAAVPLIAAMLIGSSRQPGLLIALAAIVVPFLLLAHHEDRFLLPALPLLLTLAGIGSALVADHFLGESSPGGGAAAWRSSLACAGFWIVLSGVAVTHAPLWHYIYENPGMDAAERIVNADPSACGVAMHPEAPWARMPGYARFRPGIVLYGFSPGDAATRAAAFDYVIDDSDDGGALGRIGFTWRDCWNRETRPDWPGNLRRRICLWHREPGHGEARCDRRAAVPLVPPLPEFLGGAVLPRAQGGDGASGSSWLGSSRLGSSR